MAATLLVCSSSYFRVDRKGHQETHSVPSGYACTAQDTLDHLNVSIHSAHRSDNDLDVHNNLLVLGRVGGGWVLITGAWP